MVSLVVLSCRPLSSASRLNSPHTPTTFIRVPLLQSCPPFAPAPLCPWQDPALAQPFTYSAVFILTLLLLLAWTKLILTLGHFLALTSLWDSTQECPAPDGCAWYSLLSQACLTNSIKRALPEKTPASLALHLVPSLCHFCDK